MATGGHFVFRVRFQFVLEYREARCGMQEPPIGELGRAAWAGVRTEYLGWGEDGVPEMG